jgi:hypothetical protein
MDLCIFRKTNGLPALVLLVFCSVREQRGAEEKHWQIGERGVRKTGTRLGRAMPAQCAAGREPGRRGVEGT